MQFAHTEEQFLSSREQHGAISKIMFIFILASMQFKPSLVVFILRTVLSNGLFVDSIFNL